MEHDLSFYLGQGANPLQLRTLLGTKGYESLKQLISKLDASPPKLPNGQYHARFAPSVIVRSELQLVNIDTPRFAIRVYLDEKHNSFVNLRRLPEVWERLASEGWWKHETEFIVRNRRYKPHENKPHEDWSSPEDVIRKYNRARPIADCVLAPPKRFKNDFYFVEAELGCVYGEGKRISGIPYVQALLGFSGAACAQACAFMVSSLLQGHFTCAEHPLPGIHGMAEITAVMTEPMQRFLELKGMRVEVLIEYFVKSGRRVTQYTYEDEDTSAATAMDVIFIYVRSGLPVLLPVGYDERGKRAAEHNHVVVAVGVHKQPSSRELVINCPTDSPFIQWTLSQYQHYSLLPAADFAAHPTDNAATQKLGAATAMRTVPSEGKPAKSRTPTVLCVLPEQIRLPLTLTTMKMQGAQVTFVGVDWIAKTLCADQKSLPFDLDCRAPTIHDFMLVQVLRVSAEQDSHFYCSEQMASMLKDDRKFHEFWEKCPELGQFAGRWCWLQACRSKTGEHLTAVLLWDAEAMPRTWDDTFDHKALKSEIAMNFLLLAFNLKLNAWNVTELFDRNPIPKMPAERCRQNSVALWTAGQNVAGLQPQTSAAVPTDSAQRGLDHALHRAKEKLKFPVPQTEPKPRFLRLHHLLSWLQRPRNNPIPRVHSTELISPVAAAPLPTMPDRLLTPCLITSFHPVCSGEAAKYWPSMMRSAEFYAFMKGDRSITRAGIVRPSRLPPRSVIEVLAGIGHSDVSAISRLAKQVHAFAEDASKRAPNVTINALATYMPQMFSSNPRTAAEAVSAMRALVRTRSELLHEHGHDIRTIEIVSGCLIEGLFPADCFDLPEEGPNLFAIRRTQEDGYRILLKRLSDLCAPFNGAEKHIDLDFSFSLELEPGPLFVLNGMQSLLEFSYALDESEILRNRVGFNVDIAHYVLAGIQPEALFASEPIAKRICHFHISDHGTGHFGDAPITDCAFGAPLNGPADRTKLFDRWLRAALHFAAERRLRPQGSGPRFSGLISVELEAAESPEITNKSCVALIDLLRRAEEAYAATGLIYSQSAAMSSRTDLTRAMA